MAYSWLLLVAYTALENVTWLIEKDEVDHVHNNFVDNLNCADNLNYAVSWNCSDIVAFNNCFLIYHPLHLEEVTSLLKKMRLIMSSPLIDIIIIIWLNYDYSIMSSPFMSLRIEYMASFSWLSFWPLIDLKKHPNFSFHSNSIMPAWVQDKDDMLGHWWQVLRHKKVNKMATSNLYKTFI